MKRFILLIAVLFSVSMAFAQEKQNSRKPDEQIGVNKEYDENGNLTGYDSTCVRSWSSDTTMMPADTEAIRKEMEIFFGNDQSFGVFSLDHESDSMIWERNPFENLHQDFFRRHQELLDSLGLQEPADSVPGSVPELPFIDLGQLREQMMSRFGQFFQHDSIRFKGFPGGEFPDSLFFDPEGLDQLKKDFREHFDQDPDPTL